MFGSKDSKQWKNQNKVRPIIGKNLRVAKLNRLKRRKINLKVRVNRARAWKIEKYQGHADHMPRRFKITKKTLLEKSKKRKKLNWESWKRCWKFDFKSYGTASKGLNRPNLPHKRQNGEFMRFKWNSSEKNG